MVEGGPGQTSDIFQVVGGEGARHLVVNGRGHVVIGSDDHPTDVILHDVQDGRAYSLRVTNGQLVLARA